MDRPLQCRFHPYPGGDDERGRCPQAQPPSSEPWFLQTPPLPSFQSLSHCELITDDGILHLSNSPCGHERLRVLELDNCLLITDVALEHLEHCRGLERLELYDCQQVTRAGIKRMRVSGDSRLAGRAVQATAGTESQPPFPLFCLGPSYASYLLAC